MEPEVTMTPAQKWAWLALALAVLAFNLAGWVAVKSFSPPPGTMTPPGHP